MKKTEKIVRIIFAVALILFGIVGFSGVMSDPGFTGKAGEFFSSLYYSGYLMHSVYFIKIVSGLLMLLSAYKLIGLIMALPITINIVTFHLFLDPAGIAIGAVLLVVNLFLIYTNRSVYNHLILKT